MVDFKKVTFNLGYFIGILSGMLWGLNDVFTNIYASNLNFTTTILGVITFALVLSFVQDFSSSISIFIFHFRKGNKISFESRKIKKKICFILFLAAVFAGPFGMASGIIGITYAGPIYAGVITSCYPIAALFFSIVFLKERPLKTKVLGVFITVLAVIFISIAGEKSNVIDLTIGFIFSIFAMISWGTESILFAIAQRKTACKTSIMLAIRQMFSSANYLLLIIIMCIYNGSLFFQQLKIFFNSPVFILLCTSSASLSYLTYYYSIKKIGPSLATTFNASFVFWAVIFSMIFSVTQINASFISWSIILMLGIYLASARRVKIPNLRLIYKTE